MIKNEGLSVKLPQATTSAPQRRDSSATVTLAKNGEMYLDKQIVNLETLKNKLIDMKSENPDLKVFINGDEHADFGQAIEMLDEIRSLGISKVTIQTKKRVL